MPRGMGCQGNNFHPGKCRFNSEHGRSYFHSNDGVCCLDSDDDTPYELLLEEKACGFVRIHKNYPKESWEEILKRVRSERKPENFIIKGMKYTTTINNHIFCKSCERCKTDLMIGSYCSIDKKMLTEDSKSTFLTLDSEWWYICDNYIPGVAGGIYVFGENKHGQLTFFR